MTEETDVTTAPAVPPDIWRVWQLLDSAFPTGGFAHSGGLEAAWQQGWIGSGNDVRQFVLESVAQAARGAVPFVNGVFAGMNPLELDEHLETMLANHVANRASRLQGRALASTADRVFGGAESGITLAGLRRSIMEGAQPGHQAVVFGVVLKTLGLEQGQAIRMYLFMAARGVVSAAVRLGAVGPLEAQRLQAGLSGELERHAREAELWMPADAAQCAFTLDLWQMSQDRLYSRLFQS